MPKAEAYTTTKPRTRIVLKMLLQRGKKKTTQKLKELNTPYTHIIHKFTSCVKKQKQLKKSSPEYLVTNTNRKNHPTLFPLCQRPKEKPEKG